MGRGPRNGAFNKPCLCPAKTRGFLTKTAKMTNLCWPVKQGLCCSNPAKRRKWRKWRVSRGQRHGLPNAPFPVLPLLDFLGKWQGKPSKKTRIFYPYRTPKIPGKEGKNAQKNKSSQGKKTNTHTHTRNSKKQGRTEFLSLNGVLQR